MPAVTVALHGGLGNQLFQYAMGRALARRLDLPLVLDHYGFEHDTTYRRRYELGRLRLAAGLRHVRRPGAFHLGRLLRRLSEARGEVARAARPWFLVEPSPAFAPAHLERPADRSVYVSGYWQDERYFAGIAEELRGELVLGDGLSPANAALAEALHRAPAVAVHARRLHGVGAAGGGAREGLVLGPGYYGRALAELRARVANPRLLVFSDAPGWAREHLPLGPGDVVLEHGRGPDLEDLFLMALCRHHVLANSSFGWWGAWLGEGAGQVVVAPDGMPHMPNRPDRWIGIPGRDPAARRAA